MHGAWRSFRKTYVAGDGTRILRLRLQSRLDHIQRRHEERRRHGARNGGERTICKRHGLAPWPHARRGRSLALHHEACARRNATGSTAWAAKCAGRHAAPVTTFADSALSDRVAMRRTSFCSTTAFAFAPFLVFGLGGDVARSREERLVPRRGTDDAVAERHEMRATRSLVHVRGGRYQRRASAGK